MVNGSLFTKLGLPLGYGNSFDVVVGGTTVASGLAGDSDYTFAGDSSETGWVMEIAIPWRTVELEGPPAEGEQIGFNIMRNRPREVAEYMQWSRTYTHALRPELFGRLRF